MTATLAGGTMLATETAPKPAAIAVARSEPIAITGAGGLVGTHVCRELARRGWTMRALVRNPAKAAARLASLPVEYLAGDIRDPAALHTLVSGSAAVVHLAAIAMEQHGQSYEDVNTAATLGLLQAMRDAGVRRIIHMSQNGSSSASPFRFLRSKGIAEDAVVASGLEWTIMKPSVIVGPEDEFVNVLARLVRLSPLVYPLPGGGKARFQPVAVDDVARAVGISLDRADAIGQRYVLGGPVPLSLREMTERILVAMHARRWLIPMPVALLRPVIAIVQRLLPNPPVTTGLLDLLSVENTVPNNALTEHLGVTPVPFAPEELMYLRDITAGEALRSLFRKG